MKRYTIGIKKGSSGGAAPQKRDHERTALEALWEAQAIVDLLDRLLDGGANNDLDFQDQEKVGHAVRAVRRRLEDSVTHFAESWL